MIWEFLFHGLGEHYEYLGHGGVALDIGGIREKHYLYT